MKLAFKITPHSFVDLITNSSSEVFICSNDKQITAMEEVLKELAIAYNTSATKVNDIKQISAKMEIINVERLYTDYFKKPEIAQYSIPCDDITQEYYCEFCGDNTYEHPVLKECDNNFCLEWGKYSGDKYDEAGGNMRRALRDKHYKPYDDIHIPARKLLISHLEKYNNIPEGDLASFLVHSYSDYGPDLNKENYKKYIDFVDIFYYYINNYEFVQKGDILIYSARDNSVPWDFSQFLENTLGFDRIHLG